MTQRTLIFGDVHGCWLELQELLDKCEVTSDDRVISLGDCVDRGPGVREAVDFFMSRDKPEARSMVQGNHEERLLKYYARWMEKGSPVNPEIIKSNLSFKTEYHERSFLALEPKHFEWFKTLPKFLRLPEFTGPDGLPITLVHAGCVPEVPLEAQSDHIIMHVSNVLPPSNSGGRDINGRFQHGYWTGHEDSWWTSKAPEGAEFWASIYDGSSAGHVVFGHSGFLEVARFPHATGIDLGCAFGRELCALILPEWKFVTVPARAQYAKNNRIKIFEVYPGIEVYS